MKSRKKHYRKSFIVKLAEFKHWLTSSVTSLFIIASIIMAIFLGILNHFLGTQLGDIVVEAHGLFFDLLIFGILLTFYERLTNRKTQIENHLNTIDAFRDWHEEESKFRIVNAIKKLNDLGSNFLPLNDCFLENSDLQNADLQNSILSGAILKNADLTGANLENAEITDVDLRNSILEDANFRNADLTASDLRGAVFNSQLWEGMLAWRQLSLNSKDKNDALIFENKLNSVSTVLDNLDLQIDRSIPFEEKLIEFKKVNDEYFAGAILDFCKINEDQIELLKALGADTSNTFIYPRNKGSKKKKIKRNKKKKKDKNK